MGSSTNDKLLFTPGPVATSYSVKLAALSDFGSRDSTLVQIVAEIRHRLLVLLSVSKQDGFEALLLQGSGTFAIEAVFDSLLPSDCKILLLVNGQYGQRMHRIAQLHHRNIESIFLDDNRSFNAGMVDRYLTTHGGITHVAAVHCETGTGLLNPVASIGAVVKERGLRFIVDAMSTFGGLSINMKRDNIDCLITSANKCLQSIPGIALVIASREILEDRQNCASSMCLDLPAQWDSLEQSGQFRFTPPTQVLVALLQALKELEEEGGVEARSRRYASNQKILVDGMHSLGFSPYIDPVVGSNAVTLFRLDDSSPINFKELYNRLSELGFIIYRGPDAHPSWFRVATMGHLFANDVGRFVDAVATIVRGVCLDPNQKNTASRNLDASHPLPTQSNISDQS